MIDEVQAVELFRFADPVQSVRVEVRCGDPLRMAEQLYYGAEIVVESGFVSGRVGLQVSLEAWTSGSGASTPFRQRREPSGRRVIVVPRWLD